ncbi:Zn-dependent protease [Motilibacter rhizosphaerae]|uniref:Zn-dependent protease n=1 Tax=Motilibacter rhizosphaerae TaxID=598652 RepID=A0A4Q7NX16_9ACTN|nr:M50 family metallopeptidase [Motilibacter rhizosphaerae]RZS91458.1 Zn-dependent protease [Motilibacter rhizosphaerae]
MRVLGFPLRLTPWLPVVLVALAQGRPVEAQVAFVVGGVLAILVHELGHALAARAAGARDIRIELVALGGVTSYEGAPRSRLARIGIAVAGPATGVALGLPLLAVQRSSAVTGSTVDVLDALVFVTLGWAVLNLLPVRPFDGGHVLESVLPGDEGRRARLAGAVSVVLALAVVAWAWERGLSWTAGVFLVVAALNLGPFLARGGQVRQSPEQRTTAVLRDVVSGQLAAARERAATGRCDAVVAPLLALAEGAAPDEPLARLEALVEARPDPLRRAYLLVGCVVARRFARAAEVVAAGPLPAGLPTWAVGAVRAGGRPADAALVGQAALAASPDPALAHATARAWGAAGEPQRAYDALAYARALGWADLAGAAVDPDLAEVRALPAWGALFAQQPPRNRG